MLIKKTVARCDACGFEWIPLGGEPERCPSRKCRSRKWNASGSASEIGMETKVLPRGGGKPELPLPRPLVEPKVVITKTPVDVAGSIPGVRLGAEMKSSYYVPEKYRKGGKSKFFKK